MTKPQGEMKPIIIHNTKELCKCKTFTGMKSGHCVKCKKAFKNCDICYPEEQIHKKQNEFEERVEKKSVKELLPIMGTAYSDFSVQVAYKEGYNKAMDIAKEAIREARIPESRISQLRQWINEKPKDRLVTNEDIELWLYGDNLDK